MAKARNSGERSAYRCLIVERHAWETGFNQEQLQIPLAAAEQFFGPGDQARDIFASGLVDGALKSTHVVFREPIEKGLPEHEQVILAGLTVFRTSACSDHASCSLKKHERILMSMTSGFNTTWRSSVRHTKAGYKVDRQAGPA